VGKLLQSDNTVHLWEQFVESGELAADNINPVVAASWKRCYTSGVDPMMAGAI